QRSSSPELWPSSKMLSARSSTASTCSAKVAISIEVEASTEGVGVRRIAVPGNPRTIELSSTGKIPAKVVQMFVRTGTRETGFEVQVFKSIDAIRTFLTGGHHEPTRHFPPRRHRPPRGRPLARRDHPRRRGRRDLHPRRALRQARH